MIEHKSKIDQLLAMMSQMTGKPAQEIMPPVIDIDKLREHFASKNPPENTIKRIEALE